MDNLTFTAEMLKKAIRTDYKRSVSWRKVGEKYGITGGMAYRIAHGYEPKSAHMRAVLGLPALVELPPCKTCGGNHGMKNCPTKGKPRARRAISLTDPESAACTIINHMSAANVRRLVEFLDVRLER